MNDKVALQLRLDAGVHAELKSISEQEMRSLNAQIEYFLLRCIEWYRKQDHQINLE